MKRDPEKLSSEVYDLLIIGGGINGACAAWDAALRGLSVALVDKGDFGAETSANSLKIIHGGLRYLQQADFYRMRKSSIERSILMGLAPDLIRPISFTMPTYSKFRDNKNILAFALKVNDMVAFDRNRLNGSSGRIPSGRVITRDECLKIFSGFHDAGLTGGATWYDCQVQNSERLTLSFLLSAAARGAETANYMEVMELLTGNDRVHGVRAVDVLTGTELEIRARVVLNATGPWMSEVMRRAGCRNSSLPAKPRLALALNVISRKFIAETGICFRSRSTKEQDPICGGERFLFLLPWRGHTIIGTSYRPFNSHPDDRIVREEDLAALVDECNAASPALDLSMADISYYHQGLVPLESARSSSKIPGLASRHVIIDHTEADGCAGLVSVIGVKYTMARAVAQEAIDLVFRKLGYAPPNCSTSTTPLCTGRRNGDPDLTGGAQTKLPPAGIGLAPASACRFSTQAVPGPAVREVPGPAADGLSNLGREVLCAVRQEMAVKLADVVFRRTEMGSAACPPKSDLDMAVRIMGEQLGWTETKQAEEVRQVITCYSPLKAGESLK